MLRKMIKKATEEADLPEGSKLNHKNSQKIRKNNFESYRS